jgi:aryl-alcohol dehydrogenase-like predicted oxidoreductase
MDQHRLGRTDLMVSRSGFGALPIQRITIQEAGRLLRKAYDRGINFFDTARAYTDSEEKIGAALADVRERIIIATKTGAEDRKTFFEDLERSLSNLKTDYIDIYQLHNPKSLPNPDDSEGLYQAMLEAKRKGMIRFIGITNHRLDLAVAAVDSGLYDTVQYPLSLLSNDKDLELINICEKKDIGLIAMKALSGGLINNGRAAFAFLRQYQNVLPIWGVQKESELDEFLACEQEPPILDETMRQIINKFRVELSGEFCRGCGYCLPCPAQIQIPIAARMALFLERAVYQSYLTDEWREQMNLIENCIDCGHCRNHCPYELDTPSLLKRNLIAYREFDAKHSIT